MQTVLLCHQMRGGRHFDWLVDLPTTGPGRLWTGRVQWPSDLWSAAGAFLVDELAAHRRAYLTYQGPIAGGRGSVVRVDWGAARLILGSPARIVLDITMRHYRGRMELRRLTASRWRAVTDHCPIARSWR